MHFLRLLMSAIFLMSVSTASAQQLLATPPTAVPIVGVQATLVPGDSGPRVQNLQTALAHILSTQQIRTFDLPNQPTVEQLASLSRGLASESITTDFGSATRSLVLYVQIQQGLGDSLGGVVDSNTAVILNRMASGIVSGPALTCAIARVAQGDRRAVEPNTVTIEMIGTDGRVVNSAISYLRLYEQATLKDASLTASWCRFSMTNVTSAFRAVALYGYKGRQDALAIPAQ